MDLDISKLTSSTLWQSVIVGVVIAGTLFGGMRLLDRGDNSKLDDIHETVTHISVEQSFLSEDIAEIQDKQERMDDSLLHLRNDVSVALEGQEDIRSTMASLGRLLRNQQQFTPEQFEILLQNWMDDNTSGRVKKNESPTWMTPQLIDTTFQTLSVNP